MTLPLPNFYDLLFARAAINKKKKKAVVKAWALKSPTSGELVWVGSRLVVGITREAAVMGLPWMPYVVRVIVKEL